MPKAILLFADGTGNSAANLFKTNVWRLYQAVDLSPSPAQGLKQIAFYHDGVGTSALRPIQLLGSVFGLGLKRNILAMYIFLCRNYERGDKIYLFGFSRGAFTARVFAALVLTQGLIRCQTDEELSAYAPDAYRAYRRRYKLPLLPRSSKAKFESTIPGQARDNPFTSYYRKTTVGLVDRLRDLRDVALRAMRRLARRRQYSQIYRTPIREIAFLGVWDTVAAYGMPLEELTRGIDDWVWPLSMPNTILSPQVRRARHALALDEERDSFQPLLWDEANEQRLIARGRVDPERMRQVWFAGVHSNIGGGYADDTLSHVSLEWMMDEAREAGLRLKLPADWGWSFDPNPFGRLYDSRSGIAGYYRPQSRRLAAKLKDLPNPPAGILLLQDPQNPPKLVQPVRVHESVMARITAGSDRYAPTSLPPAFTVVGPGQPAVGTPERPAALQSHLEEWIFDDIWRRRVIYFVTVGVSVLLAAFPLIQLAAPPSACVGPQCLLAPVIRAAGGILPGFLSPWIASYALTPGWFLLVATAIVALMQVGATIRLRIQDGMRELWIKSYNLPVSRQRPAPPVAKAAGPPNGWVYRLRTNGAYQRTLRAIKWRMIPTVFGLLILTAITAVGLLVTLRTVYAARDHVDAIGPCGPGSAAGRLVTADPCGTPFATLEQGRHYRVTLTVEEPWSDDAPPELRKFWLIARLIDRGWFAPSIPASPKGIDPSDRPWWFGLAGPLRRAQAQDWFQPILRIHASGGLVHLQPLTFEGACLPQGCGAAGNRFTAEFSADRTGAASIFVNDAVGWPAAFFYRDNAGTAAISLEVREGTRWVRAGRPEDPHP